MKKLFHHLSLIVILLSAATPFAWSQTSPAEISGKLADSETQETLAGVSIVVKGTVNGTISDSEGRFVLKTKSVFPVTLVISFVGYKTQEINVASADQKIDVQLAPSAFLGEEVVVTASRVEESQLKSPVAIEKLDTRDLKETPAPSFYDALENVKGVQMTTSSLTFKVPNTRGFNIPNNFRFMQLVDGVDMQAATLGVPLGNAIGPTELDIESIEITPGAASALYGMNAINGMANLVTKSPFLYQGLSVYHKSGVNHVDGVDRDPSYLGEVAIRYAKAYNDKFAFKINASFLKATDWLSSNTTDQNSAANTRFPELTSAETNPAYDGWNSYGNESNNNGQITINDHGVNKTFNIRRTGYWEKDLVNPTVQNAKADASFHFRPTENLELSYAYRFGEMDGIFQRGNKIQLDNVTVQNHKIEVKGASFLVRAYASIENTGDSYNLKPLADNLDLTHLSNSAWANKFKTRLQELVDNNVDLTLAMQQARAFADEGRVEPGTKEFNALKNTIIGINNWDHRNGNVEDPASSPETGGAWLRQLSRTYHADAQWDLSKQVKIFDLLIGGDVRIYEVVPDGNNFVDFSRPIAERNKPLNPWASPEDQDFGSNVYYKKYGFFTQITKTFFKDRLKVFGSARLDHNLEFDPQFNPRVAVVYTAAEKHNFRISFQNGFRFPALFEALSFVNNGNVRRVGGLSYINEGLGYLDNSYTLASVTKFNDAVAKDKDGGMSEADAVAKNSGALEITNLAPTRPERINSFEIGYKSVLFDNKLSIDIDAYTNEYDGFLGQVEVAVPKNGTVGSDAAVADMRVRANQIRYRVFTNAKQTYHNYGSSLGLTYNFYRKFTIGGNINYNDISANKEKDIFVTGFNTPKWATNLSFGNREVIKNVGFNIVWRWQDAFLWESPLANGNVPAYSTIDAQVSYKVPVYHATFKLGGSNILNNRYIQYAAGPTIGGLYYVAVTVDGLLAK